MENTQLTDKEKQSIKTLNFIATFDGVITNNENIKYLLHEGIKEFIAPEKRHLVNIVEIDYVIQIVY